MHSIRVTLGASSYDALIERGLLDRLGSLLANHFPAGRLLLISDATVNELYGARALRALSADSYTVGRITLPSGEQLQQLESLRAVSTAMHRFGMTPDDAVLILGGGRLLEVASLAVSGFKRGIRQFYMPTTLVGMLDCAVGGKTYLGMAQGKNMIGSFCPPDAVFIDPAFVCSLPDRLYFSGMGEALKCGCALDASLFHLLETLNGRIATENRLEEIICRCLELKRQALSGERKDDRVKLHLGHEMGQAIETAQRHALLAHGEAVALGILLVCRQSERLGITARNTSDRIEQCMLRLGMSTQSTSMDQAMRDALAALPRRMELAMIERIGWCSVRELDSSLLSDAWFGPAPAAVRPPLSI